MKNIEFSGFTWEIKDSKGKKVGPGPSVFSSSKKNVYVDSKGLHLKTSILKESYSASEVILIKSLGFGTYEFEVISNLNKLEKNTVLGAFLYEDDEHEIDIEFSPNMVGKNYGQYVVQPGSKEGNVFLFKIPSIKKSVHKITWTKDEINFESSDSETNKLIYQAIYKGENIPQTEKARMIFNLWLYEGKKPKREEVVVISYFKFNKI